MIKDLTGEIISAHPIRATYIHVSHSRDVWHCDHQVWILHSTASGPCPPIYSPQTRTLLHQHVRPSCDMRSYHSQTQSPCSMAFGLALPVIQSGSRRHILGPIRTFGFTIVFHTIRSGPIVTSSGMILGPNVTFHMLGSDLIATSVFPLSDLNVVFHTLVSDPVVTSGGMIQGPNIAFHMLGLNPVAIFGPDHHISHPRAGPSRDIQYHHNRAQPLHSTSLSPALLLLLVESSWAWTSHSCILGSGPATIFGIAITGPKYRILHPWVWPCRYFQ